MKKIILSVTMLLLLFATVNISVAGAEEKVDFKIKTIVDYDAGEIKISGITPAHYRQLINIIIYTPERTVGSMSNVTNLDDPQQQFPLTNLTGIVRINNINADISGEFEASFKTTEMQRGYYVVSASGGGYMSNASKDSELIYVENTDYLNQELLPKLSSKSGEELKILIAELGEKYGYDLGAGYDRDQEKFVSLFINIRESEYNGAFSSIFDVLKTIDGVNLIMTLEKPCSEETVKAIYEENCEIFALYDKEDEDYIQNSENIYHIIAIMTECGETSVGSISDVRKVFWQAQGLATINKEDVLAVTASIHKYGEVLGIGINEYDYYCNKYGERRVNSGFVGYGFKTVAEFISIYERHLSDISKSSAGGDGGGGGGCGGGGSATTNSSTITIENVSFDSETISYRITGSANHDSTVIVAMYDKNLKLLKLKKYTYEEGTFCIDSEILLPANLRFIKAFCFEQGTINPTGKSKKKRVVLY